MRLTFIFSLLFIFSPNIFASEIWECTDRPQGSEVLVVAKAANSASGQGSVTVAGTMQQANYYVAGFQRHWEFGNKVPNILGDSVFEYSFVINPNGDAEYTGDGTRLFFKCTKKN